MVECFAATGCSVQQWAVFVDDATGREFWDRTERNASLMIEVNDQHRRTGRVWVCVCPFLWVLSTLAGARHYHAYHGMPEFK